MIFFSFRIYRLIAFGCFVFYGMHQSTEAHSDKVKRIQRESKEFEDVSCTKPQYYFCSCNCLHSHSVSFRISNATCNGIYTRTVPVSFPLFERISNTHTKCEAKLVTSCYIIWLLLYSVNIVNSKLHLFYIVTILPVV